MGSNNRKDDLEYQNLNEEPFVSIHLPLYNELNVAERIIQACLDIQYPNYEVLVLDDSRDDTIKLLQDDSWRLSTKIKIIHRGNRSGYKGGALNKALRYMHPKTEFIIVFDADFVPPPDIVTRFLKRFNEARNSDDKPVAAVQGYQCHSLNKAENWVTKGVRSEYSGSYMIERVAEERYGGMKMISGSVFMLRASIAKTLGWTTSITEDWELTLKLYLEGFRVVYTPFIAAYAEIPSTINRLARQRMRWAEGHTYNVKRYFWRVITSSKITVAEKLEFLYFAPYYLQSFFWILGTIAWIISELTHRSPVFWSSVFGWSLIFSNFFALPFMSLAGLYIEGEFIDDFTGVFSFIAVSFFLTFYQSFAALKGLIEVEEGTWIRTLKTGSIADRVLRLGILEFLRKLLGYKRGGKENNCDKKSRSLMRSLPWRGLMITLALLMISLPFAAAIIAYRFGCSISVGFFNYMISLRVIKLAGCIDEILHFL